MKNKVITLNNVTRLDLPADRVLENAIGKLEGFVLVGFDKEGKLYCASTYADGGDVLWLLESCKHKLFESIKELENDE